MSTKESPNVDDLLESVTERKLVIYNDNHNTFEWVILNLMALLRHTLEQAEQCAHLIHHRGKYAVKVGFADELKPYCDALRLRGLNARIE